MDARTSLVNAARGFAKASGERLPACDADSLDVETMDALPAGLQERLRPLLEQIARIEYPETKLHRQINGVGFPWKPRPAGAV